MKAQEKTKLENYKEQLSLSISLGRPLIHIETSDYDWECKILYRILISNQRQKSRRILSWSPYRGFRDEVANNGKYIYSDSPSEHLIETLNNFLNLEEPRTLVIKDIAYYFNQEYIRTEYLSRLSSRLYDFYCNEDQKNDSANRSIIIIVCPKFDIPIELQGYLYRITPPFPDEDDIAHELGLDVVWEGDSTISKLKKGVLIGNSSPSTPGIFYRYRRSFFADKGGRYSSAGFDDNKKKILSAFKGMRIKAIQTLLSYNKTPYEIEGGDNSNFLLENKKRMVMDSGLLKLENVPKGYRDYVGDIDGLKDYMQEVKTIIDNRANYNENMSMPKGILLVGPPGCGKSETSKAIADILDLPLLSLDMGSLMSKWSGEQEHNFENAIALAEAAQPCVLRIDELEKAFSGTGNNTNNDQSSVRVLGFFLTWMQERTSITSSKSLVYLVATANNLEELRPEFLRKGRWDEIFYLIYPTAEGMAKIVQSCLRKYKLSIIADEDTMTSQDEYNLIKKVTSKIFEQHPKCKISGAEIADAIERVYKKQFKSDPSSTNLNVIDIEEIDRVLEDFAKKNRNYELDRKIRDEIRNIQIEHQKRYHPLTVAQSLSIKNIVREKYSKKNIEVLIQQEIATLRVNHYMQNSTHKFNTESVSKAVRDKYTDEYITKLVNDEYRDITMSFYINNEPEIDSHTIEMLEAKLREKFEDVQDFEEYYESKGYKSASNKPQ